MPLVLKVGLCKRKSIRNLGVVGANCQLEVELPSDILRSAGSSLQRESEMAFDACRDTVHAELARDEAKAAEKSKSRDPSRCWTL